MRLAEFKVKGGGECGVYKVLIPPNRLTVTVNKEGHVRVWELGGEGAGYEVEGSLDAVKREINAALNHGDSKLLKELKKVMGK